MFEDVLGYHVTFGPNGGFIRVVTASGTFPPVGGMPMGPFNEVLTSLFLSILNSPHPRFNRNDRSFECRGTHGSSLLNQPIVNNLPSI